MSHRNQQLLREARKGHVEGVERWITDGADVNFRGKYGYTPLMEAASQGHLETVQHLLNRGADPLIGADDNAPPAFFACVHGFADVVELLLNSGADPNALRDSDFELRDGDSRGVSQLEIAVRNGFTTIALALIEAGANIDHVSHGKTPLEIAVESEMTIVADRIREVDRQRMQNRQTKLAESGRDGRIATTTPPAPPGLPQ